jgi:hypothetical protein
MAPCRTSKRQRTRRRVRAGGAAQPRRVAAQRILGIPGLYEPNSAVGCTSALIVRREFAVSVDNHGGSRPFGALGTYAATARIVCGDEWIWLASVHASPSVVPTQKRRLDFRTRTCEVHPWWADPFLAELRSFADRQLGAAVIAGDLNEARAYDDDHGHVCGGELLKR